VRLGFFTAGSTTFSIGSTCISGFSIAIPHYLDV
jgi:hypothetical protein